MELKDDLSNPKNKVHGDSKQYTYTETNTKYECIKRQDGFSEQSQLSFYSHHGCSKGTSIQYILNYTRIFRLKTVVFRYFYMYGRGQFAIYDQDWVDWLCQNTIKTSKGLHKEALTISGTGKQVRDVLRGTI